MGEELDAPWPDVDAITQRYWRWRVAQPQLYALAERFARELYEQGFAQYSADALLHRVRWHVEVETGQHCEINNVYTPLLARELMDTGVVPEGFFEVRRRPSCGTDERGEPRVAVLLDPQRAASSLAHYFRGPRLDALIKALRAERVQQRQCSGRTSPRAVLPATVLQKSLYYQVLLAGCCTDDALVSLFPQYDQRTIAARRIELEHGGFVRDTGRQGTTRRNKRATLWEAVLPEGWARDALLAELARHLGEPARLVS